jgi:hypothetical protein
VTLRISRRAGAATLALALMVGGLAACGSEGGDEIQQTGIKPSTTTTAATDTGSGGGTSESTTTTSPSATTPQDLQIVATEYSYDLGGVTEFKAGDVHVTLKNQGKEDHQAQLARIKDGQTLATFKGALQSNNPNSALAYVDFYGGPNAVAAQNTGESDSVLPPGQYVVLCLLPAPDGKPHVAHGMIADFKVTGTLAADAAPPKSVGTLTLKEFAFGLPADFNGQGTYLVDNQGTQPHEVSILKLKSGKTQNDVTAYFANPSGEPPYTLMGGVGAVSPGTKATFDLDLDPGDYVFACFVPDPATGKSHVEEGMIQTVTVK